MLRQCLSIPSDCLSLLPPLVCCIFMFGFCQELPAHVHPCRLLASMHVCFFSRRSKRRRKRMLCVCAVCEKSVPRAEEVCCEKQETTSMGRNLACMDHGCWICHWGKQMCNCSRQAKWWQNIGVVPWHVRCPPACPERSSLCTHRSRHTKRWWEGWGSGEAGSRHKFTLITVSRVGICKAGTVGLCLKMRATRDVS